MVDERKRLLPPRLDDQEADAPFTCCLPRINNRTVGKTAILITLALERVAFYSLSGNLILFLNGTDYNWVSYSAVNASYFFLGMTCIFYFIGGILADIRLGRFKAIFIGLIIYLIGYMFFPVISQKDLMHRIVRNDTGLCSSSSDLRDSCAATIYIALLVIGVGSGIFKANIAPFGADQLKGQEPRSINVFFNWYYWCSNIGTLAGLGGVAYIQQTMSDTGFFRGYLIAVCCLFAGIIVFLLGKCAYIYRETVGSYFINMFKIIREAWRIRKRKQAQYEHRLNVSSSSREFSNGPKERAKPISFLDHAKFRFGGNYHDHSVDDIKKVGKILLVFTALIPYWMVYFQLETTFLMQGLHMRLSISYNQSNVQHGNDKGHSLSTNDNEFNIAIAWLMLFDVIMLLFLIPIMDRIIYPWIRRKGWNFSMVKRMSIGLFFSMLAIIIAGVVEWQRLRGYWVLPENYNTTGNCNYTQIQQKIQDTTYNASTMSILWQIPQCALIGLSEIFTSITGLEFASVLAPKAMKSSVMGLFYFFSGLGSFFSLGLMAVFYGVWFWPASDQGNINCRHGCNDGHGHVSQGTCHLDYYFYLLGGIQAVGAVFFIFICWKLNLQNEIKLGLASSGNVQSPRDERPRHISSSSPGYPNSTFSERLGRPSSASASETEIAHSTVSPDENHVKETPKPVPVKRTMQRDSTGRIGAVRSS